MSNKLLLPAHQPLNASVNQSINPANSQSINQPMSQSIKQSIKSSNKSSMHSTIHTSISSDQAVSEWITSKVLDEVMCIVPCLCANALRPCSVIPSCSVSVAHTALATLQNVTQNVTQGCKMLRKVASVTFATLRNVTLAQGVTLRTPCVMSHVTSGQHMCHTALCCCQVLLDLDMQARRNWNSQKGHSKGFQTA